MAILGIDYGEKRIGLALADAFAQLPTPLKTIDASQDPVEHIAAVVRQEGVTDLVVGIARNMDGSLGPQAEKCRVFGADLAQELALPVHFTDETLSSVEAAAYHAIPAYKSAGLDAAAAACILDRYFEELRA